MKKRLKEIASALRREAAVYRLLLRDERTPMVSKALLWLALGYALMPFDLVPDWIPVLGQLDDLVVVPALVLLALRFVPDTLVADCRRRALVGSAEAIS